MPKRKAVTAKAVSSSITPVPEGNIMGVMRDVDQDEIRRAYRQLAVQYRSEAGKAPEAASGFTAPGVMGGE